MLLAAAAAGTTLIFLSQIATDQNTKLRHQAACQPATKQNHFTTTTNTRGNNTTANPTTEKTKTNDHWHIAMLRRASRQLTMRITTTPDTNYNNNNNNKEDRHPLPLAHCYAQEGTTTPTPQPPRRQQRRQQEHNKEQKQQQQHNNTNKGVKQLQAGWRRCIYR